jgi:large subunit ribosomal protein L10
MPNAKILQEKEAIVAKLAEKMKSAASGVLVDYKGITVAADTKLRTEMRKAGVDYAVYKNTMLLRAAKQIGFDALEPILHGTTALAVSSDLVTPAKILCEYAKKSGGKFSIKGGFVEGNIVGESSVQELAEMPPREVLVARALAGFNAPITGLVNVLNGNLRGLVVALNAIAEKKSA